MSKVYTIPVEWTVTSTIKIKAESLEDAVKFALDNLNEIPLSDEYEYLDGSYCIATECNDENAETIANDIRDLYGEARESCDMYGYKDSPTPELVYPEPMTIPHL